MSPASTSAFKGRTGEINVNGDGEFESGDIGFTVYKGYPYCENCHVRLRMPKCKRCQRSIRDGEEAVEALGGKWCWNCFVCTVRLSPLSERVDFVSAKRNPVCYNRDVRSLLTIPHSSREQGNHFVNLASASSLEMNYRC